MSGWWPLGRTDFGTEPMSRGGRWPDVVRSDTMNRASALLIASSLLACGGQPEPSYQPQPETQQPTKFMMQCGLTLWCHPNGIEPYYLTKPAGSYCTAYESEARLQAKSWCPEPGPSSCSCTVSCFGNTRCR